MLRDVDAVMLKMFTDIEGSDGAVDRLLGTRELSLGVEEIDGAARILPPRLVVATLVDTLATEGRPLASAGAVGADSSKEEPRAVLFVIAVMLESAFELSVVERPPESRELSPDVTETSITAVSNNVPTEILSVRVKMEVIADVFTGSGKPVVSVGRVLSSAEVPAKAVIVGES